MIKIEHVVIFYKKYVKEAKSVYDNIESENKFLISSNDEILCSLKFDIQADKYYLIGIECIEHKFDNSIKIIEQIEIDVDNKVIKTKNQNIMNYLSLKYDGFKPYYDDVIEFNSIQYLMKECSNSKLIDKYDVFGIVFTNKTYESVADKIIKTLSNKNCYKLYTKDVSYERLYSIDIVECVILIDCPLFNYNLKYITPFSVYTHFNKEWNVDDYDRNIVNLNIKTDLKDEISLSKELKITNQNLVKKINNKSFLGVEFKNHIEDMNIHEGNSGIASDYKK
ncbi:hypothetical protein A0H76_977 [Hepatospora eriocheir]|uniref:Diphthamide biosynthesis protein 2 n=1 Tax=Hepatospora eriocheir TaxID=1081669 RepID=A0A1X0QHU1_9MICR|nr:hypothetical protein A0H76_977 [Hepatospora eriocheir]